MKPKLINRAIKEAKKSQQRFKHAALILRAGAVISFAFNTENTHAEVRAIKRASSADRCTLISIRVNANGEPANAKPCLKCWNAMIKAGIEDVKYSNTGLGTYLTWVKVE